MSIAAILEGTLQHLQTELSIPTKNIGIEEDGQPPPHAGDVYYSVHPTGWLPGNNDPSDHLDERFSISVTVTQRTAKFPQGKRMENAYLEAVKGMERRCRDVMLKLHLNYVWFALVNSMMDGTATLAEPLRWLGTDAIPRAVDGTWFWSEPDKGSGMAMEVRFGDARRFQRIIKAGTQDVLD